MFSHVVRAQASREELPRSSRRVGDQNYRVHVQKKEQKVEVFDDNGEDHRT